MPRLIALDKFTYATKVIFPGSEFEAVTEEDARLLCGFGKAQRISDPNPQPPETSVSEEPRQQRYRRRDMRADR